MKNHIGVYLNLHIDNDAAVIKKLEKVSNRQGYIKKLILDDHIKFYSFAKESERK